MMIKYELTIYICNKCGFYTIKKILFLFMLNNMFVECRNILHCHQKIPIWDFKRQIGLCIDCVIQMGPHTVTNIEEECPVCLDIKRIIYLECKHSICTQCWYEIANKWFTDATVVNSPSCPVCRHKNDWNKK